MQTLLYLLEAELYLKKQKQKQKNFKQMSLLLVFKVWILKKGPHVRTTRWQHNLG